MNELALQNQPENLPTVSTERSMIQSIAQMAMNPDIDPDKMERLLNVQLKLLDRQAKIEYDQALADLQMAMPRIGARGEIKNKAGEITSRYLKYEDIDRVIRPLLQQHGFSLLHNREDKDGKMIVTTILKHRGGHQDSISIPLPYDQTNALKSALQAAASTASFGKRHNVCSLLNIVAEGDDDDGVGAGHIKIDDSQKQEIVNALRETGADTARFLAFMGVRCVDDIPMKDYAKAYMALKRKVTGK